MEVEQWGPRWAYLLRQLEIYLLLFIIFYSDENLKSWIYFETKNDDK